MKKIREQETRRRYRRWLTAVLAGFCMCTLVGCGSVSSKNSDSAAAENSSGAYDMTESVTEDAADAGGVENAGAEGALTDETGIETDAAQTSEKIIYTYNYSVETKAFDTFMDTVENRINAYGGYVESSETNGNSERNVSRYANMVIRIPSAKMKEFLTMVERDSNVTYAVQSSENVTLSYVDLESHVKALKIEQETLLGLLEQAKKLDDILTLQSQLTEVRYQLESYESQLRVYDNRIDYATLYLDINEVERETKAADKLSYGEEIKQGLSDTFYELGQGLRSFSIWLIVNLPVLLLWIAILALLAWVVYHVAKHVGKTKEKRQQKKWRALEQKAGEESDSSHKTEKKEQ